MENITVEIYSEGVELAEVKRTISKFQKKNNLNFKVKILIDWFSEFAGYYYFGEDEVKLFVNPINCQYFDRTFGYTDDNSFVGVMTHEFSHCIDDKYGLQADYRVYTKANGRLMLNDYVRRTNISEEIAELVCLYINNPYLLKHIDVPRYKWLSKYFKSTTPCSEKNFKERWKAWDGETRKLCWKDWGIKVVKQNIYLRKRKRVDKKRLNN